METSQLSKQKPKNKRKGTAVANGNAIHFRIEISNRSNITVAFTPKRKYQIVNALLASSFVLLAAPTFLNRC